jgi:hypothetical protein
LGLQHGNVLWSCSWIVTLTWRGEILCIRLEWDGVLYVDERPSCREPLRLSPSSTICDKHQLLVFQRIWAHLCALVLRDI